MKKTYYLKPCNGQKSFNNKAVVIEENNKKELYSYNSLVCTIEGDQIESFKKVVNNWYNFKETFINMI